MISLPAWSHTIAVHSRCIFYSKSHTKDAVGTHLWCACVCARGPYLSFCRLGMIRQTDGGSAGAQLVRGRPHASVALLLACMTDSPFSVAFLFTLPALSLPVTWLGFNAALRHRSLCVSILTV